MDVMGNAASLIQPQAGAFTFDPATNAAFDTLLAVINDETDGMPSLWGADWRTLDSWEQIKRLRIWLRRWLDNGMWYSDSGYVMTKQPAEGDYLSIPAAITYHAGGGDGYCTWYATWFIWCCQALGFQARRQSWAMDWDNGDNSTEVYVPSLGKWVAVSTVLNCWWSIDGVPLSAAQMCAAFHTLGWEAYKAACIAEHDDALLADVPTNQVWQQAQGEWTIPNEIHDPHEKYSFDEDTHWPSRYAWDVMPVLTNTYGAYPWVYGRYQGPGWVYSPNMDDYSPTWVQGTESTDITFFDFDAARIQVGTPTLAGVTLTIPTPAKAMANFANYRANAYDAGGTLLRTATWTGTTGDIDVTGTDSVKVYAENNRGGTSNVVTIAGVAQSFTFDVLAAVAGAIPDPLSFTFDVLAAVESAAHVHARLRGRHSAPRSMSTTSTEARTLSSKGTTSRTMRRG